MKFSSLSLMASSFSSKLMGISTADNLVSAGTNSINSPNSFFDTVLTLIKSTFADLFTVLWESIVKILYTIIKWMLTIIDFLFIFIREMVGMNTDFTSVEDISESDVIFQFIFSDEVTAVIRGMIGLAIVLLIIFSIFAIVKSEYDFVAHGKATNSKKGILVSSLKSLLLMVLVPVIAIGGIILSNAILKSLYMATAGGTDVSMGTQVFVASGYNANAYRHYANNGYKIPITFNFEEVQDDENVTGWGGADSDITELDTALQDFKSSSVWNKGLTTFYMFYTDGFLDMESVDTLNELYRTAGGESSYHAVYDKGLYSRSEEYYVMADVIDYSIKNRRAVYFKTIEEVYTSYKNVYNSAPSAVKEQMSFSNNVYYAGGDYCMNVHYYTDNSYVTYKHKPGAKDEAKGAVFMIAIEKSIEYNDKVYTYYAPLISGQDAFSTDYHENAGYPVVAKGIFEKGENPTAIKEEDGVVKFYRDDLNVPTLVDFFPTISYELPEGVTEDLGIKIIKGGFQAITGVSADQFIPYVYYSFDVFNLFTKTTNSIVKLENGRMYVDYNFTQRNFTMENLYKVKEINLLILTFSSVILVGMLIKVLFGVSLRVLDITLLFISYPAVLSTMPLDNGGRFNGWTQTFIQKLLGLYGVVIGINVMLLLFPIIDGLDLITPTMVATAFGTHQLFSGVTARFLNYLVEVLFMLVGFTSIQRFAILIEDIFNEKTHEDEDLNLVAYSTEGILKNKDGATPGIIRDGAMVVNDLASLPKKVGDVVSGKIVLDAAHSAIETAYNFLPGAAVVSDIKDRVDHFKNKNQMKKDEKEVRNDIKNASSGKSSNEENTEESTPADESQETPNQQNQNQNTNGNQGTSSQQNQNSQDANENQETSDASTQETPDGSNAGQGTTGLENNGESETADESAEAPSDTGDDGSSDGSDSSDDTGDASADSGGGDDGSSGSDSGSNGSGGSGAETGGDGSSDLGGGAADAGAGDADGGSTASAVAKALLTKEGREELKREFKKDPTPQMGATGGSNTSFGNGSNNADPSAEAQTESHKQGGKKEIDPPTDEEMAEIMKDFKGFNYANNQEENAGGTPPGDGWKSKEQALAEAEQVDKWKSKEEALAEAEQVDKWKSKEEALAEAPKVDKWKSKEQALAEAEQVDKWKTKEEAIKEANAAKGQKNKPASTGKNSKSKKK